MERPLLTSNLREETLKRLSWFVKVPASADLDKFFLDTPVTRDEVDIITQFSKYTRGLCGEDPEATPDDALEEKRWKRLMNGTSNHQNGHIAMTTTTTTTASFIDAPTLAADRSFDMDRSRQLVNPKKRRTQIVQNLPIKEPVALNPQYAIMAEGQRVVAKLDDGWMMMNVIKFNKRTRMYTLEDADEQAESKEEQEVHRDLVVPLPSPAYSPPVFQPGNRVLAMYPGTTSFYPALVVRTMKRAIPSAKQTGKPIYDYMLQFDGDEADSDGVPLNHKVKGDFVIDEVMV